MQQIIQSVCYFSMLHGEKHFHFLNRKKWSSLCVGANNNNNNNNHSRADFGVPSGTAGWTCAASKPAMREFQIMITHCMQLESQTVYILLINTWELCAFAFIISTRFYFPCNVPAVLLRIPRIIAGGVDPWIYGGRPAGRQPGGGIKSGHDVATLQYQALNHVLQWCSVCCCYFSTVACGNSEAPGPCADWAAAPWTGVTVDTRKLYLCRRFHGELLPADQWTELLKTEISLNYI